MVNSNLAHKLDNENTIDVETNDIPLKWCSVSLSDVIFRGKRLEASVFDVEAIQALALINNGKYKTVPLYGDQGIVNKAHYGSRLKRNYVTPEHENSIGFISSSEMLDIYPRPVKFMVDGEKVHDLHVKEGTVLLSRSGTIGNVTFVNKTLSKFLVSEHAIRLECTDNSGYVYTFLKTKIGKKLVCSNIYGAVIQQIEPAHLTMVPVPDAPKEIKERIHNLIVESFKLRDESNELIDQATALLIDELKLPSISEFKQNNIKNSANVNAFSVKLSNLAGRVDASYHLPIVDAIVNHLRKYAEEVTTVGDERISSDIILPGRFKRVYVDEGFGRVFIGGKQLWELDPTNKKYLSNSKHNTRIIKELEISENTTLITRSGTIGKVTMVPKHWEHWVTSEHIIRVVPSSSEIAGYLNVFLASDYGNVLIKRFTYGSVVDEIDDNHVSQIAIPLLKNKDVQKQINNLALEANQKRYKAFLLEQQALEIMDNEVIFAK
ncbi:restriction endonuclease subunit S [Ruminococcoides intestinale]|uniref:Restriction endonuclease subunit S n=1 Tax=Ruminococcoides intestinale TaxID=3133162 RepID=A0ABV1F997_9FIRM